MYATMTLQLYFVSDVDRSTCRDLFIRNNIHVSSCWYMFRSYAWIHLLSTCFWTAPSYKYIPGKTILLFSAACSVLITLYKIQMKISCSFSSRSFWNRATYHFTSCCNLFVVTELYSFLVDYQHPASLREAKLNWSKLTNELLIPNLRSALKGL